MTWKKFFFDKIEKGVKNAEFYADFESVEKVLKECTKKKLLAKRWRKNALFSLLLMFVKLVLLITFFWCIFSQLFQQRRNQREILRFLTPFSIFSKKNFFRSYEYFFQTLKPGGGHTRWIEREVGVKILRFWMSPDTALYSTYIITLCLQLSLELAALLTF